MKNTNNSNFKKCKICGKEFVSTFKTQLYCSHSCKRTAFNQRRKIKRSSKKINFTKICPVCGKKFETTLTYKKYCSAKCRKKQTYNNNIEHIKEYSKKYYKQNVDKIIEYHKKYRTENKDIIKKRKKINNSKPSYKYKANKRRRYRLATDPQYKIKTWVRKQMHRCLSSKKQYHTFEILGYTPHQLIQRLEFQFHDGMTWENHGTMWHIDHIKPLCAFNLVLPDGTPNYHQIKLANSLCNLRPLFVEDNLSKSGKWKTTTPL